MHKMSDESHSVEVDSGIQVNSFPGKKWKNLHFGKSQKIWRPAYSCADKLY